MKRLNIVQRKELKKKLRLSIYYGDFSDEMLDFYFDNYFKPPRQLMKEALTLYFTLTSNAGYKKIAYQQLLGQVVEDIQQSIDSFIIKNIPDYNIEPRSAAGERKAPDVVAGTADVALTGGQAPNTVSATTANAEYSVSSETSVTQPNETAAHEPELENTDDESGDADGDDDEEDIYGNLLNSWSKKR